MPICPIRVALGCHMAKKKPKAPRKAQIWHGSCTQRHQYGTEWHYKVTRWSLGACPQPGRAAPFPPNPENTKQHVIHLNGYSNFPDFGLHFGAEGVPRGHHSGSMGIWGLPKRQATHLEWLNGLECDIIPPPPPPQGGGEAYRPGGGGGGPATLDHI